MRYSIYFFLFLLFTNCKEKKTEFFKAEIIPTIIDSLNTKNQIENYIRKLRYPIMESFDYQKEELAYNFLEKFELKKIIEFDRNRSFDLDSITKIIADSLNISESFYKADIDNNGFTDLLVIGDNKSCQSSGSKSCDFSVYSFMNFGNDSIRPVDLIVRALFNSIVPKISTKYNAPILEIYKPAEYHWTKKKKISKNEVIDLTYRFGSFIEYNKVLNNYHIEKIEFQTEFANSKHPIFEILINDDQTAILKAKYDNSIYENTKIYYKDTIPELKGEFKSIINKRDYDNLVNLLNYMDFPNMKNQYKLRRMHTRDCSLKITYNNGETKEIKDYGMFGTYGLNRVYELLYELRFNQEWK